jgi:hypothetical protein
MTIWVPAIMLALAVAMIATGLLMRRRRGRRRMKKMRSNRAQKVPYYF